MRYQIRYLPQVPGDLRHFPPETKKLVQRAIDELSHNPHEGSPLADELAGFWKYRAKRYRIIYEIHSEKKEIIIWLIDRRESVYERLRKMLEH